MPTELEELKQIYAELSELAKCGAGFHAQIEKWPLLYKRKPASARQTHQPPGIVAYAGALLSDTLPIAGEFEPDGRPWLDANGNPIVNSVGRPFRMIPGWKASVCLVDETIGPSADAQEIRKKITEMLKMLGRFLPAEASSMKLSGDSVGPWLLHLAQKCASGAAGKRHQTQWAQFGWTDNGCLVQVVDATPEWPPPGIARSLGDPPPQMVEIADVAGASRVVLSEWISEMESRQGSQLPEAGPIADTATHKFAVAFTFPGEKRSYVEKVDKALQILLGPDQIFYDKRYEHELARLDLDTYLQSLYHDRAELIVVFLCSEYNRKDWCGIEWRAVRDIIKKRQGDSVMPFRFDNANIPGLLSIDGYIDAAATATEKAAELIQKRLLANRRASSAAVPSRDTPPANLGPAADS